MNEILVILKELRPDAEFENSNDFVEEYLLDSFDIMSLTAALEEKYGVKIPVTEIIPENFKSIDAITVMVRNCGGKI
jgi:acyl carrier protein